MNYLFQAVKHFLIVIVCTCKFGTLIRCCKKIFTTQSIFLFSNMHYAHLRKESTGGFFFFHKATFTISYKHVTVRTKKIVRKHLFSQLERKEGQIMM